MYNNYETHVDGGRIKIDTINDIIAMKGESDGIASLDSEAKLEIDQIPDLLLNNTYVVTDTTALLALTNIQKNDICVVTDEDTTYINLTGTNNTIDDWQTISLNKVYSVASKTGDVVLVVADITDLTATATELNYCSGVTSDIQTQIDGKTSELVEDLTPELGGNLDTNGYNIDSITPTELSYLSGVTSNIQTQIDNKSSALVDDITPKLGGDLDTNGHNIDDISPTELSYLNGVTSNIQTQLNNANAVSIKNRIVDDTAIGDKKVLTYDLASDTIIYTNSSNILLDENWTSAGQLVAGKSNGEGVILNSSGVNDEVLVVDTGQISGLNWKSLSDLVGVENDLLWDAKGDLAVGIGINRAINLMSGTNGQILKVKSDELTGLAWIDEITVATDPIWNTAGKGSLLAKFSYVPEGGGEAVTGITTLPVGANDYILTADSNEQTGLKWKTLSEVFDITDDSAWTSKGELVVGTGSSTASILSPSISDNYILTTNSSEPTGLKWVSSSSIPVNVVSSDEIWNTKGDMVYADGADSAVVLNIGSSGQVLKVSTTGIPSWVNNIDYGINKGGLLVGTDTNVTSILPVGANGNVLTVDASDSTYNLSWKQPVDVFNVATDQIWDASGDLAVGTGTNSAVKLTKGSEDQVLSIKGASVVWSDLPDSALKTVANDSLWTAKGDIAVGTGVGSANVLSVSSDGKILMSDSTQPTGVKWTDPETTNSIATDLLWNAKGDLAVGTGDDTGTSLSVGTNGQVLKVDDNATNKLSWQDEIKDAAIWSNTGSTKYEQIIAGYAYNDGSEIRSARVIPGYTSGYSLMTHKSSSAEYPSLRWADSISNSNLWSGRYNLLIGHSSNIDGEPDSRYAEILPIGEVNQQLTVKWHDGGESGYSYKYLAYDYDPTIQTIDAKGDILVGSANDSLSKLPIGENNYVLTVDSNADNLLAWKNVREPLSLLADDSWSAKGDLAVGIGVNTANILSKGNQGQILSVDNITTLGLKWIDVKTVSDDDIWYQAGDLAIGTGDGTATRFPVSSEYGYVLISDPTDGNKLRWVDPKYITTVSDDNIWDAKGDLAVGTGVDTGDNLSVGTDGQVLVADSTQTLGVKWDTIGTTSEDTTFTPNGDITSTTVQNAIVEVRDDTDIKLSSKATTTALSEHTTDTTNPHEVTASQVGNTIAQWNANKINSIDVDNTDIADGYVLSYDATTEKIVYVAQTGGSSLPTGVSGDILYNNGTDWIPLNKGNEDQVLKINSGIPSWQNETGGSGAVVSKETVTVDYTDFTSGLFDTSYSLATNASIVISGAKITSAFNIGFSFNITTEDDDIVFSGDVVSGVTGVVYNPNSNPLMNLDTVSKTLKLYIPNNGAWSTDSAWNLNTARSQLAGCGTQSSALSFGGQTGSNSAVTEKFDGTAWSTNAAWNLNTARYSLAGCGTQSSALSFGGTTGSNLSVTEKFITIEDALTQGEMEIKLVVI